LSWKIACPTLVKDTFQVSCRVNETLFSRPRGFCHSKWQPKLQSTELRSCVQKGLFYPRQAGRQKVGGTITLLLFHDCTCTTLTPRHHHHTPRQTTASPRGTHHRYHNHTATPHQLTPPLLAQQDLPSWFSRPGSGHGVDPLCRWHWLGRTQCASHVV
jgi:hypothetical protein